MISKIAIRNFMGHSSLERDEIPMLNVLIGKNDTGKTGLLKLMYAVTKSEEVFGLKRKSEPTTFKKELADKLLETFKPRRNGLGDLVTKGSAERLGCEINLQNLSQGYQQSIHFYFGERTERLIQDCSESVATIPPAALNALFIPSKEVLTILNEVRATRESLFMPGFDDTYLDLIKALLIPTVQGRIASNFLEVNEKLQSLFEGEIQQTGDHDQPFMFKRGKQVFSMPQTSEGIKKIGILTTLIRNRQINGGTVLFMDEPETALHPGAIRELVEMLASMSKAGVQVFVATHSYFVLKQFSLIAKREKTQIDCWSLDRNEHGIAATFSDLRHGMPENAISAESLQMYEEDLRIDMGVS